MNKKLIDVLQRSIHSLESGAVEYSFQQAAACNCGILAQHALNKDKAELKKLLSYHGSWGVACTQTGLELNVVFATLFSLGLDKQDICKLEMLSNDAILKEAGITHLWEYDSKDNLILYLKAWVRILQREQPEQQVKYVVVHIDRELITDTNKSLINVN